MSGLRPHAIQGSGLLSSHAAAACRPPRAAHPPLQRRLLSLSRHKESNQRKGVRASPSIREFLDPSRCTSERIRRAREGAKHRGEKPAIAPASVAPRRRVRRTRRGVASLWRKPCAVTVSERRTIAAKGIPVVGTRVRDAGTVPHVLSPTTLSPFPKFQEYPVIVPPPVSVQLPAKITLAPALIVSLTGAGLDMAGWGTGRPAFSSALHTC